MSVLYVSQYWLESAGWEEKPSSVQSIASVGIKDNEGVCRKSSPCLKSDVLRGNPGMRKSPAWWLELAGWPTLGHPDPDPESGLWVGPAQLHPVVICQSSSQGEGVQSWGPRATGAAQHRVAAGYRGRVPVRAQGQWCSRDQEPPSSPVILYDERLHCGKAQVKGFYRVTHCSVTL